MLFSQEFKDKVKQANEYRRKANAYIAQGDDGGAEFMIHNGIVNDLLENHYAEWWAYRTLCFKDPTDRGHMKSSSKIYKPYKPVEDILASKTPEQMEYLRKCVEGGTFVITKKHVANGKPVDDGADAFLAAMGARYR